MNWLDLLADELIARGVPARERRRIALELRDHIDCEPGSEERLGDPTALAATFADELATVKSRRSALRAFAALSATAVALAVSQVTLGRIGYPGFDHGLTPALFWPALLGIFIAPQVALVAGALAAVRALRRRRAIALPAAELALITRRTRVALAAAFATVAGLELYVIDFSGRLPSWWLGLTGGLAVAAGGALVWARRGLAGAVQLRSSLAGSPGEISADLPVLGWRWLRGRPWRLGILASLIGGGLMAAFEAHAEHSLVEGVQRGVVEGLAAVAGFAVLGRALGVTAPRTRGRVRRNGQPVQTLRLPTGAADRRATDGDRAEAERLVRDSFACGQLSIEELTQRVTAIHAAATLGGLRNTLIDLL